MKFNLIVILAFLSINILAQNQEISVVLLTSIAPKRFFLSGGIEKTYNNSSLSLNLGSDFLIGNKYIPNINAGIGYCQPVFFDFYIQANSAIRFGEINFVDELIKNTDIPYFYTSKWQLLGSFNLGYNKNINEKIEIFPFTGLIILSNLDDQKHRFMGTSSAMHFGIKVKIMK